MDSNQHWMDRQVCWLRQSSSLPLLRRSGTICKPIQNHGLLQHFVFSTMPLMAERFMNDIERLSETIRNGLSLREAGGEGGIRTHGRGNPDTRSPGVPVRPLQHLSAERVGFEPTLRINRRPLFESGTINHSVTSPWLRSQLYHT